MSLASSSLYYYTTCIWRATAANPLRIYSASRSTLFSHDSRTFSRPLTYYSPLALERPKPFQPSQPFQPFDPSPHILATVQPPPPVPPHLALHSSLSRPSCPVTMSPTSSVLNAPTAPGWVLHPSGTHYIYSQVLEKSDNDDREYRLIRLVSNQLEVLLIHDHDTDKSSAALDVHVGHLSDPAL
ncbi:hypothetical protein BC937DRAFT_89859 [Endogone sp. FLAS-F59071]|nr:hypothetical protein BC937DRAFT_89859 [Endogone sp. FLAS-F59071]|eukprot:RUS17528.1 hypothetical protein BC937DRAFT_89859 [Endogone sp. FLAS-F59071]